MEISLKDKIRNKIIGSAIWACSVAWVSDKKKSEGQLEALTIAIITAIGIGANIEGLCYYCKKPIDNLTGNPNLWGIPLCHGDEPGKVKPHHIGCVSERLKKSGRYLPCDHLAFKTENSQITELFIDGDEWIRKEKI